MERNLFLKLNLKLKFNEEKDALQASGFYNK